MSNAMEEMLAKFAALLEAKQPQRSRKSKKSKGKGRVASTPEEKAARMAANDAECIKVFTKAGYKDVKPRVNVLTYNKWLEAGRKVKEGEKSHKVNKFSLFHIDQTDALPVGTSSVATGASPTA